MKFACKVCVSNRELSTSGGGGGRRYVNGTVALCSLPRSPDCCVLVFTGRDKAGTKYPLRGNVRAVLARFAAEGKATLQFARPPHDLLLQAAEPLQLRAFLRLLRAALEPRRPGAPSGAPCGVSSLAVTALPGAGAAGTAAARRLTIRSRADYPARGLPRTLEELHVNGVGRAALDPGVLLLTRLRTLDYADNALERLPDELARLPCLRELDVSRNRLRAGPAAPWGWTGGRLAATLVSLSLADNGLAAVPDELCRLLALQHLDLRRNQLRRLPSGVGRLRQLRSLLCSDNKLATLPGSIRNLRLQTLDVAGNPFEPLSHDAGDLDAWQRRVHQVRTLKEYAGRRVLSCRLPYCSRTIPATLVAFLDHAEYCTCGEACFTVFFRQSLFLPLATIASELTLSPGNSGYVPVDSYFCSLSCYSACRTRCRGHIVR